MSAGGTSGVGAGALTKFIDQMGLEKLNTGSLAEGDNLSQFGSILQIGKDGKVSDASFITGSVMQEVGATMRSFAQAHTMSRLAKMKVQCLAIELARESVQQQQAVMEKVIAAFHENLALQERVRQTIEKMHEQYRQDLKEITKQGFAVLSEPDIEKQKYLKELLKEEREGIKEGFKAAQKSLNSLAKSAKIDPEIINKALQQSTDIINNICKTVRTITKQNEEQSLVDMFQKGVKSLKAAADKTSQETGSTSGTT